jgi:hypothetical protein
LRDPSSEEPTQAPPGNGLHSSLYIFSLLKLTNRDVNVSRTTTLGFANRS